MAISHNAWHFLYWRTRCCHWLHLVAICSHWLPYAGVRCHSLSFAAIRCHLLPCGAICSHPLVMHVRAVKWLRNNDDNGWLAVGRHLGSQRLQLAARCGTPREMTKMRLPVLPFSHPFSAPYILTSLHEWRRQEAGGRILTSLHPYNPQLPE